MPYEMRGKILVASMIFILLIGTFSTPINAIANENKNSHDDNDDHHKPHNSCQNIPRETPFRDLWIFVCSLQVQIDQINDKLNNLNSGGGGTGGNFWCPTATSIFLNNPDLRLQNLVGCNLSNAALIDGQLQYANLRGANLTNANLQGSNLSYADLTNANLSGTSFKFAILSGTVLTGATTDSTTDFTGAHGTCIGNPICGTLPP